MGEKRVIGRLRGIFMCACACSHGKKKDSWHWLDPDKNRFSNSVDQYEDNGLFCGYVCVMCGCLSTFWCSLHEFCALPLLFLSSDLCSWSSHLPPGLQPPLLMVEWEMMSACIESGWRRGRYDSLQIPPWALSGQYSRETGQWRFCWTDCEHTECCQNMRADRHTDTHT